MKALILLITFSALAYEIYDFFYSGTYKGPNSFKLFKLFGAFALFNFIFSLFLALLRPSKRKVPYQEQKNEENMRSWQLYQSNGMNYQANTSAPNGTPAPQRRFDLPMAQRMVQKIPPLGQIDPNQLMTRLNDENHPYMGYTTANKIIGSLKELKGYDPNKFLYQYHN